jgi:hypothetical protein
VTARTCLASALAAALLACPLSPPAPACCPAPPSGKPVVNADQTVILLWDPSTKTEHFVRQASFKSDADDFGFLIPSPAKPELAESGDEAFPFLRKLTEPEVRKAPAGGGNIGCGCGAAAPKAAPAGLAKVTVLEEKRVAGFNASVLEANDADGLVGWLKDHGYAYSPEVKAWAAPYVEAGWKVTALKVAKGKEAAADKTVGAASLRLSFKADRPLFPYREPDPSRQAAQLGASHRLLRIYFLADARYQGGLTKEVPWTGKVAWSGKVSPEDRTRLLGGLKLPQTTGPAELWLTEFEDDWSYRAAPADVYFARDTDQAPVRRPPVYARASSPWPTDVAGYALAAALVVPPVVRRVRRSGR